MRKLRILIVHPDPEGLALLASMLGSLGHDIEEASNDRAAARLMERKHVDLVLAVADPGDHDALELLTYVRRKHRAAPVVLLFPHSHPDRTKEALRMGAATVLKCPVPAAQLRAAVSQALEHHGPLIAEGLRSPKSLIAPRVLAANASVPVDLVAREPGLLGNDPIWKRAVGLAITLADVRSSVLIVGEPGTGKSAVARLLHALGPGEHAPFVAVDAAGLADVLSTADGDAAPVPDGQGPPATRSQKLDPARGGTFYLDEIASLSTEAQLALLRELQCQDHQSSSAHPRISGDVRFVLSTRESLPALVARGEFHQELFHRVSTITLVLPPLRHRGADLELLAETFLTRFARESHKNVVGFTRDALDVLESHHWPGNVRELEGVIRRCVAASPGSRITSRELGRILGRHPERTRAGHAPPPCLAPNSRSLKDGLEEQEKRIILQALQSLNWSRRDTARALNISRATLYHKMKKCGLFIAEPAWAE